MKCSECSAVMVYYKGEDEDLEGNLVPYSSYFCEDCGYVVNDWEDEFEWPEDSNEQPL
jgi:hypothetical protein